MYKKINTLILLIFLSSFGYAQKYKDCFPEQDHQKNGLVYDISDKLSSKEETKLRKKLETFSDSTSNQIVVIITDELCGMVPAKYATELGQEWGAGQRDLDNGVVVLVAPEIKKTYIATGDGIEGAIPDITAGHIIDQEMIPNFKTDDYSKGINQGTDVIMSLAKGEYDFNTYNARYGSSSGKGFPTGILIFIFLFFLMILLSFLYSYKRARDYAKLNNISVWAAFLLISQQSRKHSGTYGDFRGGHGGFGGGFGGGGFSGGGGGGGFGGFGGGSFGGGGAGGSW